MKNVKRREEAKGERVLKKYKGKERLKERGRVKER